MVAEVLPHRFRGFGAKVPGPTVGLFHGNAREKVPLDHPEADSLLLLNLRLKLAREILVGFICHDR
jgi:hypothetical protein